MINPITLISFIIVLLRPHPLPAHSNIFSYPLTPLYTSSFYKTDILVHPILESLRSIAFNYFNYLSPKFLFTILYPVEILLVSLGIYYLANSRYRKLNILWFTLLILSPIISGLLLIIPLSILISAGMFYLLSKRSILWRLTTFSLFLIWIFQIIKQLDFYLVHIK